MAPPAWQGTLIHRVCVLRSLCLAAQVANQRFADVVLENYLPSDIM